MTKKAQQRPEALDADVRSALKLMNHQVAIIRRRIGAGRPPPDLQEIEHQMRAFGAATDPTALAAKTVEIGTLMASLAVVRRGDPMTADAPAGTLAAAFLDAMHSAQDTWPTRRKTP